MKPLGDTEIIDTPVQGGEIIASLKLVTDLADAEMDLTIRICFLPKKQQFLVLIPFENGNFEAYVFQQKQTTHLVPGKLPQYVGSDTARSRILARFNKMSDPRMVMSHPGPEQFASFKETARSLVSGTDEHSMNLRQQVYNVLQAIKPQPVPMEFA